MKLSEIVTFRKDLLFNGAVQIGWLEINKKQAEKAAENYVFHGPDYHGVSEQDFELDSHKLIDTAKFTLDLLEHINGDMSDEPFALAIAGYGTGKSHLGVTLSSLLKEPSSDLTQKITQNILKADTNIGTKVREVLAENRKPFIVVAINGMQDFDLNGEIIRQVLLILNQKNINTTPLENLRPRFRAAINFTESFYNALKNDFKNSFGGVPLETIVEHLRQQDENIFCKVSKIYEQKMGAPIRAVGQESLHDFIKKVKEIYCGEGKPFAGLVIIFDEFGRYMEFAVQKPHVAGSGALQQLFESVQANGDKVYLLCFIQFELKAYISRVAPELREDLNRYVTRYDSVHKVRLSTNLETLIANLLEKKNISEINKYISELKSGVDFLHSNLFNWFPEIKNHSVWADKNRFEQIICRGCWPFHPLSTWVLFKLASVGKSLQQRSALSFLADAYLKYENQEIDIGKAIMPVDICTNEMVNEFLASEQYGQQGASAHAYESVLQKYHHELSVEQKSVLKAVLLLTKIGIKLNSKSDCLSALSLFTDLDSDIFDSAVHNLVSEYGILEWNERLNWFEIVGDAIPKRAFLSYLGSKVFEINLQMRSEIFSQNYVKLSQNEVYNTDFGSENNISTRDWNYKIYYSNVSIIEGQLLFALRNWYEARNIDECKGQLIYCYVGPESNIDSIKEKARETLKMQIEKMGYNFSIGAPIVIILLYDVDGSFGQKLAEYWVLNEQMTEDDQNKYSNFILDRKNSLTQELINQFSELERMRNIIFAIEKEITKSRVKNTLSNLFDVVYEKRIPFPFDGFHTSRGNAAKDCQAFSKELLLGNFDKEWISARSAQQRNRAYELFDKTWGAIDYDGSIRTKPSNNSVREIIEALDKKLRCEDDLESKPVNLGKVVRTLCAPPYGCNIASAGLLISLFISKRKANINFVKDSQLISVETWLQDAMPGNYFELSILDLTDIILISEETVSEWESLLDEWNIETAYIRKIEYLKKAEELKERIPLPTQLYYKYKLLHEHSIDAQMQLKSFNNVLDDAISKVERGVAREDSGLISWGASDLLNLNRLMQNDETKWLSEQINEIKYHLSKAKVQTKNCFLKWMPTQKVNGMEQLREFKYRLINKIGTNLQKLELFEEYQALQEHVDKIEKNIELIIEIKNVANSINLMIQDNVITNTTPLSALYSLLEQIKEFEGILEKGKKRIDISQAVINDASIKLEEFKQSCMKQINSYNERSMRLFGIEEINTLSDIENWKTEVASLILVFEGRDDDIEDFKLIQKQLEIIEKRYKTLNNFNLNTEEFEALCTRIKDEVESYFDGDVPPLDSDSIYDGIIRSIEYERMCTATGWIKNNVPELQAIYELGASEAIDYKIKLSSKPRILSSEQSKKVLQAIEACEQRLDDLEIEGLIARFKELSAESRKKFIKMVTEISNIY